MARVTVEDCIDKVPNRFDLVLLAAHRARGISAGAALTVERDRDKNPVVALREIAEEAVGVEPLREDFMASLRKHVEPDEPEGLDMLLLEGDAPPGEDEPGDELDEAKLLAALRGEIDAGGPPRPARPAIDDDMD